MEDSIWPQFSVINILLLETVYLRSKILEGPSIGKYWYISGVLVLPENEIFTFFRMCWLYP